MLGSDDAIVSTASLMLGVAASAASKEAILIAGVAGLVAGAGSMAVGEYVSVSSQRDAEQADIKLEKEELGANPQAELRELARIYEQRGLDKELALTVAKQLSAHGRLNAHLRDELGINPSALARPVQAALVSAASFASLAVLPILALLAAPAPWRVPSMAVTAFASLAVLGAVGSHIGGASSLRGALRVAVGGSFAMGVTALIGKLLGVVAA